MRALTFFFSILTIIAIVVLLLHTPPTKVEYRNDTQFNKPNIFTGCLTIVIYEYSLEVIVIAPSIGRVTGAVVTVYKGDNIVARNITINGEAYFVLEEGDYRVEVEYPTYEKYTANIRLDKPLRLEVYLTKPRGSLNTALMFMLRTSLYIIVIILIVKIVKSVL